MSDRKKRTLKIEDLPAAEQELTPDQAAHAKGGLLPAVHQLPAVQTPGDAILSPRDPASGLPIGK